MKPDSQASGSAAEEHGAEAWTPAERALLDATLEFFGAANDVIEYGGRKRPQVRQDAAAFGAVRRAMAALEQRVRDAHADGVAPERIAQIARLEPEVVALILERRGAAPSPPAAS